MMICWTNIIGNIQQGLGNTASLHVPLFLSQSIPHVSRYPLKTLSRKGGIGFRLPAPH